MNGQHKNDKTTDDIARKLEKAIQAARKMESDYCSSCPVVVKGDSDCYDDCAVWQVLRNLD